jgi:putative hemolysin
MGIGYGDIPDAEVVSLASMPEPNTGCWLWLSTLDRDGYGQLNRRYKTYKAHRFAYTVLRGPVPDGMVLDHICRVRSCVNPDHLRPVTHAENVLVNSNGLGAINKAKINCGKCGGVLTVTRHKQGRRGCRPCEREYLNNRRRAKRNKETV